jgi:hypothetical protein
LSDVGPHYGDVWTDAEGDIVVASYFAMLAAEHSGQPYVKRRFIEDMIARTGRSKGSVEFKYANVSTVLEALALRPLSGYVPRRNIQHSLVDAVGRWLGAHPEAFELVTPVPASPADPLLADTRTLFVEPPPSLSASVEEIRGSGAEQLERLVRKFDPVERDARNRKLGEAGEALILNFERRRLESADRADLAHKVRWVAQEDGDGAGYDIRSFDPIDGAERWIEVKTTCGPQKTPFFISRNECAVAEERPDVFRLYRVYEFGETPKLYALTPPLAESVVMRPEVWRAGFG